MTILISKKEIREMFEDFVQDNGIILVDKAQTFIRFLEYLERDKYEWIKENLKGYFRELPRKTLQKI